MTFASRALAITLGVIGHACIFAIGTASSPMLVVAYLLSVVCLWAAAWMLWSRTTQ